MAVSPVGLAAEVGAVAALAGTVAVAETVADSAAMATLEVRAQKMADWAHLSY